MPWLLYIIYGTRIRNILGCTFLTASSLALEFLEVGLPNTATGQLANACRGNAMLYKGSASFSPQQGQLLFHQDCCCCRPSCFADLETMRLHLHLHELHNCYFVFHLLFSVVFSTLLLGANWLCANFGRTANESKVTLGAADGLNGYLVRFSFLVYVSVVVILLAPLPGSRKCGL